MKTIIIHNKTYVISKKDYKKLKKLNNPFGMKAEAKLFGFLCEIINKYNPTSVVNLIVLD